MTTRKNLGLFCFGLCLFGLVCALLPARIFAAPAGTTTTTDIKNATYSFQDAQTITATINGTDYTFTDSNITDSNPQYVLDKTDSGDLCHGNIKLTGTTQSDIANQQARISASFKDFRTSSSASTFSGGCVGGVDFNKSSLGNPQLAYAWFDWVDKNHIKLIQGFAGDSGTTYTRGTDADVTVFYADNSTVSGDSDCRDQIVVPNPDAPGVGYSFTSAVSSPVAGLAGIQSVQATAFSNDHMSGDCQVGYVNQQPIKGDTDYKKLAASPMHIGQAANATKEPASTDDSGSTGDTSDCVANSNIGLEWLLCPIITSLSKATDGLNTLVISQLNFSVDDNLNDNPGHNGVKVAWESIKNIASAMIVIVLLVVIISQALGGNGFLDAYTIRKMLPRIVIAVIAMQLSWYACRYAIGLANDAGHGIGQILSAPFGGAGNLDLGSLLSRLSGWWAAGTSVATVSLAVVLVSTPLLAVTFLPGVLLIIISVFISVLIALATLLFRNALIIMLVIFSPLALLAWVLPGTQRYWKMWTENFSKLLLLFPLMISIIYAGRIFAYIAGGLGTPGFLDLLAVLVGFFAPYFIIFKAFKWGGSALSAGHKAISDNGAIRKARELNKREMGGWQKRRIGARAEALDPSAEHYTKATKKISRGPLKGLPLGYTGSLRKTALENVLAGRVVPTKRGLAVAIKKGDAFKDEESEIARAQVKREKDKGMTNGVEGYSLEDVKDKEGNITGQMVVKDIKYNTAGGKASLMKNMGSTDMRVAGMAIDEAIKSSSWVEIAGTLVPIASKDLANEGAEIHTDADGNMFVKAYELKRWNSKLNSTGELFGATAGKFPLAQPFIQTSDQSDPTGTPNGKTQAQKMQAATEKAVAAEAELAKEQGRAPRPMAPLTPQQKRAITIMQDYTDADSIKGQSESQFGEYIRLAKQNPAVAYEFQSMLERFVKGGQSGEQALGHLVSSKSMKEKADAMLALATPEGQRTFTVDQYVVASKTGEPPKVGAGVVKHSGQTPPEVEVAESEEFKSATEAPSAAPGAPGSTTAPGGGGRTGPATWHGDNTAEVTAEGRPTGGGDSGAGTAGIDYNALTEAVARGTRRGMSESQPGQATFTPSTSRIDRQGGVLEIPHQPGETIRPSGFIVPTPPKQKPPTPPSEEPPETPPIS